MPVGNRILPRTRKVADHIVAEFRQLPVANISDCMGRVFAGGSRLRPMHRDGVLAGPALTVRSRPGDNLMLHKALDLAEPGDVIVVDAGGDVTNALIGELMLAHAINRGVAGFVLYGALRDLDAFRRVNLPTYALGVTHRGPYKHGPGEINTAIAIEGMVIEAGDLIVGDADGIVAVSYNDTADVLQATKDKQAAEHRQMAQIENRTNDRSWVDKALLATGCEIVPA
jgi:regulator of RNase E activity RraA|tara:strand:- start:2918 stop:3598 length:681 start_codon:yes stop_codon:yes gene_type:complete